MKKNVKYEDALLRLEEIIRSLESGSAELDESLSLFEEGVGLIKLCSEKLDLAEEKVRMLIEAEDGSVTDAPFIKNDNED